MEINEVVESPKPGTSETVPSLIEFISSKKLEGFDSIELTSNGLKHQHRLSRFRPSDVETEATAVDLPKIETEIPITHERKHSISISMPTSPTGADLLTNDTGMMPGDGTLSFPDAQKKQVKFLSQQLDKGQLSTEPVNRSSTFNPHPNPHIRKLKDHRYDSFKTWSGKLERQISNLRGRPQEIRPENTNLQTAGNESVPVDRYFDALEGPELETLRPSEEIVLPGDKKWPFLLRYPVSSFGIILGVSSQAILYKTLATSESTKFLHISKDVNLVLWCIAVVLMVIISSVYLLKMILFFEAVRREYYHPIRVNFFFAPWIALLFLALGVPPSITTNLPHFLWYVLMTPIFCLELKIYGQWMSGGQRRLSKVANPTNHLSVVGNFVGALLGATMGLKEGPIFFYAVGLAHYAVLFVTLYQRLPTNATLPKELHPVFFLFVAAPSVASMAWAKIQGSFDYGSRICYFIALFLYFSLAVRVDFFRGFKFSLAWWAYTFPMTGAAIATIKYSLEVTNVVTKTLSVVLSAVASLIVTALLISTIIHAFVLKDLFPNDIAIAISDRKPHTSTHMNWLHRLNVSSDHQKEIETYLKFADTDSKDLEAAVNKSPSQSNE